jgi:DNA-binding MarR family transcriptional regulator
VTTSLDRVTPTLPFDPLAEAARQWDKHWGPEPTASMVAVTSIMRAQQIMIARLNEILAPLDLTFPRYEALMVVYYSRRGELPLGKISTRLQVHRASVTNVIDKLVDSGYIERAGDRDDRRTVLARITAAGRRTAQVATERLNGVRFATTPLPDETCSRIYELLTPLRQGAGDFD